MRKNKGITLVGLIISIVILLIIAVVTIEDVRNNGLIAYAQKAQNEYTKEQDRENSEFGNYLEKIDNINNRNNSKDGSSSYIELTGLIATNIVSVKYNELTGEIKNGADQGKIIAVVKEGEDLAPIPAGFSVSEVAEEQKISTGLVIKDTLNNEFVWVPVPDMDDMATKNGKNNWTGILEDINNDGYTGREPDIVYDDADVKQEYLSKVGCSSSQEFKKQLQAEFNDMAESVSKYKGFYVARYELSTNNGKLASKAGIVTTANTNNNMWYGLYNICKTYKTNSVKSNMIYGCQYDAMIRWMLKGKDAAKVSQTSNGNHNDEISDNIETGVMSTDKINNVYDLEGNCAEWTQEAYGEYARVSRGGWFSMIITPSARNSLNMPHYGIVIRTARATLYINCEN